MASLAGQRCAVAAANLAELRRLLDEDPDALNTTESSSASGSGGAGAPAGEPAGDLALPPHLRRKPRRQAPRPVRLLLLQTASAGQAFEQARAAGERTMQLERRQRREIMARDETIRILEQRVEALCEALRYVGGMAGVQVGAPCCVCSVMVNGLAAARQCAQCSACGRVACVECTYLCSVCDALHCRSESCVPSCDRRADAPPARRQKRRGRRRASRSRSRE